ncbi:thioesterase domain-containing protein [Streptomyces diastatochromogenes]|nr:thioesterase domain-containing protein [Streptomyces diastatochromogenes]
MNSAAEAVRDHLSSMPARPPRLPYISNTTGDWADPEAATEPGHWAAHLREPVRLDTGTATLLAAGCATYIELGPGGSMTGSLRTAPGWAPGHRTVRLAPGGRADTGPGSSTRSAPYGNSAWTAPWRRSRRRGTPTPRTGPRTARCPRTRSWARTLPGQGPGGGAGHRTARGSGPQGPDAGRRPRRAVLEEVWCQTLGVASVADGDDFFTLGGESLLALALTTAVRERVGAVVSVTEFSLKGTFAGLVELIDQRLPGGDGPAPTHRRPARPSCGRAPDVPSSSSRTPSATPCPTGSWPRASPRGRPSGAGPGAVPARGGGIRALAAAHARTLLATQPEGPYTLGGWSFGAVVAHETARLLIRQGHTVDLLFSLDGYVPDTRPLPVAAAPDFLLGGVRAGLDTLLGVGPVAGRSGPPRRRAAASSPARPPYWPTGRAR